MLALQGSAVRIELVQRNVEHLSSSSPHANAERRLTSPAISFQRALLQCADGGKEGGGLAWKPPDCSGLGEDGREESVNLLAAAEGSMSKAVRPQE